MSYQSDLIKQWLLEWADTAPFFCDGFEFSDVVDFNLFMVYSVVEYQMTRYGLGFQFHGNFYIKIYYTDATPSQLEPLIEKIIKFRCNNLCNFVFKEIEVTDSNSSSLKCKTFKIPYQFTSGGSR